MQDIKIKARLVKAVAFLLLTGLIIGNLGEVFALKHETYEANNYYSFDYLYDIPKDTLDVVYIGTSQYHMGITPLEIWKEYGITGAAFNAPQVPSVQPRPEPKPSDKANSCFSSIPNSSAYAHKTACAQLYPLFLLITAISSCFILTSN